MIKRVFKTIFILSLCLGITLPANAGSANVSDGSAFITKSEMSYQLNQLSNRMTQLENSLDSRIDSLVSSYLTRNGIWSGVAQIINTSSWQLKSNGDLPGKTAGTRYDTVLSKKYTIVNKINKTGLCALTITQKSTSAAYIFGLVQTSSTNVARVYDSSFALFGYFTSDTTDDDANAKISYPVGTGFGKAFFDGWQYQSGESHPGNQSFSFGIFTQTTEVVNTYYFFVNKDDGLRTYFHVSYYVPTYTDFSYSINNIDFLIKSVSVY